MQTTVDSAAGVLTALEQAPAAALVPADHDAATQDRVQAAFEARRSRFPACAPRRPTCAAICWNGARPAPAFRR